MPLSRVAFLLVAGIAIGWFLRDLTIDKSTSRTERTILSREDKAARRLAHRMKEEAEEAKRIAREETKRAAEVAREEQARVEAEKATSDKERERASVEEWIKVQTPQWKAWATFQAKQRIGGLFADMGFDAETQKHIEAALLDDAEKEAERAMLMFLGKEEIDPAAFDYFMGIAPDLSEGVLATIGGFLNDGDIDRVRGKVKKAYERQMTDLADMQINMMQIKDLSEDQNARMREVYRGQNAWRDQMVGFAQVTRDPDALDKLTSDKEAFRATMSKTMEPMRVQVRDILTAEQYRKYEAYEEVMIRQAEMGLKMMAGMFKRPAENKTPAGK